ncbi:LuxR family transcriptional regulator [Antrihabitans sp. YC2-6]|uniref:helix-turn-helix transcriptional regulator n=1 Tax=Antrihabitans sp. YC2-6 TaxID=2799498 RepID=UPI0018F741E8|nr:LuxR family transcriptional regulator [Antrihabitans sp. YC2-6]MBJ8347246.1 AAA family ATPase [Antrihabitans sp. YC2-6]
MLHGRQAEVAELDRLLARVDEGLSGALILRGEPGIGKTALIDDVARRAGDRVCLRGRGVESERDLPFAALHQLLRPLSDGIGALPPPQRAALSTAFGLEIGSGADPFLVGVAVLTLLGRAAAGAGLVCLVDDAHWFDTASLSALVFASRRLEAEGVVVVFGTRPDPGGLLESSGLPEIRVNVLDDAGAAGLIAERAPLIGDHVKSALAGRAAGNPLALLVFLRSLGPDQLTGLEPVIEPFAIDTTVERVFADRAADLPAATQALLLLAAAEGTGDLGVLLRAADSRGLDVRALGPAEEAGLIRVSGNAIEFRHPLVMSAIYQHATTADRLDAHRELSQSMETAGAQWEDRRAWHLAASHIGPNEEAAQALEGSAERAIQRGGLGAAATALTRAAALSSDRAERGRRLLEAADLAWRAGRAAQAITLLDEAAPLPIAPAYLAKVQFLRGLIELRNGMVDKSFGILAEGYRTALQAGSDLAFGALQAAGEAATATGDIAQLAEIKQLALDAKPRNPGDAIGINMLIDGAQSLAGSGPAATSRMNDVLDGTENLSDPMQLQWAARAALYLCDAHTASSIYLRAVGHARATGAIGSLVPALGRLAYCEFLSGRFTDAATNALEAISLARDVGQDQSYPLACLALVEGARGDEDACRRHAGEVLGLAVPRRLNIVAALAAWSLGLLELGMGRPQLALDRMAGPDSYAHHAIARFSTPDLIEAAVRAGEPDVGRRALDEFEKWALTSRVPSVLAMVSHSRGMLSDGATAVDNYRTALTYHETAPRMFQASRTALLLGETLRRQRFRNEARPLLRSASERFERMGALPWADRARTELRASGENATRRLPGAAQSLTPQELRISKLAGEGLRNQEIAEQLFLSSRTVEYHLHKVFNKLDIASRAELMRIDLDSA